MNSRTSLAFLFALLQSVLPPDPCLAASPSTFALTVMTYNIHHGEGTDGRIDLERVARVITAVRPDLVALQEIDCRTNRSGGADQAAELGRLTGMTALFGRARDFDGGHYGNAILSRLPIRLIANAPLPRLDNREPRAVLLTEAALTTGPVRAPTFLFLTTHLDFAPGSANRLAAVERIEELLAPYPGRPALLAGDLNSGPDSPTLAAFRKSWTLAGADKQLRTFPARAPLRRLDYVLYRPETQWKVIDARVIDDQEASDHRPVVAKLLWSP